ncbi:MAG: GntR family transcriptional regulator [Rhizobiaceae bacterium]|nr:GntR family transcriptional regulator [Rhizobiaceae bacterium]
MQNVKPARILSTAAAVGPQVYRILREQIIQAELLPGERISESDIAKGFSISRQPVREAFIKLSEEGLVHVVPQRGTYVTKISSRSVMDVRFVREAIEADIVRQVAEAHSPDTVARLRAEIEQQKQVPHNDRAAFLRLDERFHHTLASAAGKAYAWSVIESVKAQMDRVRFLSVDDMQVGRLIEQHERIVDGIAAGNMSEAEAALRMHLREILKSLPEIARSRAEFFDATE